MKVWKFRNGQVINVNADLLANFKDEGPIYRVHEINRLDLEERFVYFTMVDGKSNTFRNSETFFSTEDDAWNWYENQADFLNVIRGLHLEMDKDIIKAGREKMEENDEKQSRD